jgi:hypothetical protein
MGCGRSTVSNGVRVTLPEQRQKENLMSDKMLSTVPVLVMLLVSILFLYCRPDSFFQAFAIVICSGLAIWAFIWGTRGDPLSVKSPPLSSIGRLTQMFL